MRAALKFNCLLLIVLALLRAVPVAAQRSSSVSVAGADQIPGAATVSRGQPAELSYAQAVQLAIQNNLATLLAHERRNEARGIKQQSLAPLLPNVASVVYQASLTENLAALGFRRGTTPGFNSTFVGPFRNFDARVLLAQTIFDLSAIKSYQAGRAGVRVAELQEGLAREQVASGTGLIYLEALRADESVVAAQANVELAQSLLNLAQDQRNAGVATGVDVTRAQARLVKPLRALHG